MVFNHYLIFHIVTSLLNSFHFNTIRFCMHKWAWENWISLIECKNQNWFDGDDGLHSFFQWIQFYHSCSNSIKYFILQKNYSWCSILRFINSTWKCYKYKSETIIYCFSGVNNFNNLFLFWSGWGGSFKHTIIILFLVTYHD